MTLSCRRTAGRRGWTWGGLTAVVVGLSFALTAGQSSRHAEAQVKPARGPTFTYKEVAITWTKIDDALNEAESRGWDVFQIVPVANANPGGGAAMQVAIILRRPAAAR